MSVNGLWQVRQAKCAAVSHERYAPNGRVVLHIATVGSRQARRSRRRHAAALHRKGVTKNDFNNSEFFAKTLALLRHPI
jgi:hypothetical protein